MPDDVDDLGVVVKATRTFGEPWRESSQHACFLNNQGESRCFEGGYRTRAIECVNACAGLDDPKAKMLELSTLLHEVIAGMDASVLVYDMLARTMDEKDRLVWDKQSKTCKTLAKKIREWQRS